MSNLTIVHDELREISRPNVLPKMLNIGLTGGVGSGKSSLAMILKKNGAVVIDVDAISRGLTQSDGAAMIEIESVFGQKMLQEDGSLDRARMRDLVFSDADAKVKLEQITYPLLRQQALKMAHEYSLVYPQPSFLIYDIPLLYGNHFWLELLDWIIVVTCTREERIRRVLKRNSEYTQELVESIIDAQASSGQLFEIADVLVDNIQNEEKHLHLIESANILFKYISKMVKIKLTIMNSNELKL